MGQPMEHVLRQSLIALRLAEYLGLAGPVLRFRVRAAGLLAASADVAVEVFCL